MMSTVRPLHLPWSPLFATAVVLWVVGEPLLAQKSSIFPPAPTTSRCAGGEAAIEIKGILAGRASRLSNYSLGEPVIL
jgi:hypothetical protein